MSVSPVGSSVIVPQQLDELQPPSKIDETGGPEAPSTVDDQRKVETQGTQYAQLFPPPTVNFVQGQNTGTAVQPVAASRPAGPPTPAMVSADAILAPLQARAETPPRTGTGNEGRLYSSPEMSQSSQTLMSELNKLPSAQERLGVLQEVARQNYGHYVGLLSKVGETGTPADRQLVTDALAVGLEKGTFPKTDMPTAGGGKVSLDPIGYLMKRGPYTGPNIDVQQKVHFTQPEQQKALGNIVDLVNTRPDAAFRYRDMLATEAVTANTPGYDFTGKQLANIATQWAAGKTGADFAKDARLSVTGPEGYTGLFNSVAKDFYRNGNTVDTKSAAKLLSHAAEMPGMKDTLDYGAPDAANAYTRAVAAHSDAIFDRLTNAQGSLKNGDDATLRSVFKLSYHNPQVDDSARGELKTGMERFVKDLKRDALMFAVNSGTGAGLADSAAARRLQLFTAGYANSYKDRYDQTRGDYEAQKQLISRTIFIPVDFLPLGSSLATFGKEEFGNNKLAEWSSNSDVKFLKSDLFKNWLNQGNSGALSKYLSDSLSGAIVGDPPKFDPQEVLNQASDVMLNLDLDMQMLRRDPAAFNQSYGLPSTSSRTGERYNAVTPEQAQRLLKWVDDARFTSDDAAFSSMHVETKQLLNF